GYGQLSGMAGAVRCLVDAPRALVADDYRTRAELFYEPPDGVRCRPMPGSFVRRRKLCGYAPAFASVASWLGCSGPANAREMEKRTQAVRSNSGFYGEPCRRNLR